MSIEVMKQALELLRRCVAGSQKLFDEREATITALRAAIEHYDQTSLELCEKCGWKAIIPSEGCLVCARQKPKPVAWMFDFLADDRDEIIRDWTTQEYAEIEREKGFNVRPLYPGPRPWVGLTDEEIEDEWERVTGHSIFGGDRSAGRSMFLSPDEVIHYTQAIETKLKEKNA